MRYITFVCIILFVVPFAITLAMVPGHEAVHVDMYANDNIQSKVYYNFFNLEKLRSTRALAYTQAESATDNDMHEWFDMMDYFFDKVMFVFFWGLGFFGLIVSNLNLGTGIKKYYKWTKEDDKFLKENLNKLSISEIAERLNRHKSVVNCRITTMTN